MAPRMTLHFSLIWIRCSYIAASKQITTLNRDYENENQFICPLPIRDDSSFPCFKDLCRCLSYNIPLRLSSALPRRLANPLHPTFWLTELAFAAGASLSISHIHRHTWLRHFNLPLSRSIIKSFSGEDILVELSVLSSRVPIRWLMIRKDLDFIDDQWLNG